MRDLPGKQGIDERAKIRVDPAIGECVFQFFAAAIAKQQLEKGEFREGSIHLIPMFKPGFLDLEQLSLLKSKIDLRSVESEFDDTIEPAAI